MAVVVWVYAGGGQAELGIIPWLRHHFPMVDFQRRTPQKRKPGPRPGVAIKPGGTTTVVVGQTGKDLDIAIRQNLRQYWNKNAAQVLVLLDDTDCEKPQDRAQALRQVVAQTILDDDKPCTVVALAVPELEVWILADWRNTFEKDYRNCHTSMRKKLREEGVDFTKLQEFDCRCGTTEYRKLSETLRDAFETCCASVPRYSKDNDTRRLLLQVDPNSVAGRCPEFKSFWNELKSCLSEAQ